MTCSSATDTLSGIWGSSATDVFAVGMSGSILHYDGSTWTTMTNESGYYLYGVWGTSASDVFAVGSRGIILHYNGRTWTKMDSGTSQTINSVWCSSPSDVLAVAWNSLYYLDSNILRYDGSSWNVGTSGTTASLDCVWGNSSSDVFAVGGGGTILHWGQDEDPTTAKIASVNPCQGTQGQTLDVTMTGTNLTGSTGASFGSGITTSNYAVTSATQVTVTISISASASAGARDVQITTSSGVVTKTGAFTVTQEGTSPDGETPNNNETKGGGIRFWVWIVVGVAAVLVVGMGAFLIGRRRPAKT
jgi:hypothetical protein